MQLRQQISLQILGIVLLAISCSGPPEQGEQLVYRFIADETTDLFSTDSVSVTRELRQWRFDNGKLPGGCSLLAGRIQPAEVAGTRLLASSSGITVLCEGMLDTNKVDLIRVEIKGLTRSGAALGWRSNSGDYTEAAYMTVDRWSRATIGRDELLFEVGRSESWSAAVDELKLQIEPKVGDLVEILSITAEARETDTEKLQQALLRSWKVDIDHDWRNALLGHPSIAHERSVTVAEGGQLYLALGLMPGMRSRVRFVASVITETENVVVIDRTLVGSSTGSLSPWLLAQADLARWEGREIRIRLSVETETGLDPSDGLPVWGHPEVRGSVDGEVRPNVILVSIDTLRADRLGLYGHTRATSPYLDEWAGRGVVFESVVTQAPWTLPSHVSMLSGVEAFRHGINFNTSTTSSTQLEMLSEILRRSGYATKAITGGGFVHPRFGFSSGFESYVYWPQSKPRSRELESNVGASIEWLQEQQGLGPFFLFLHTFEVHPPNEARQPFFSRFSDLDPDNQILSEIVRPQKDAGFLGEHRGVLLHGDRRVPIPPELSELAADLYDSAVAYTDTQLSRLIQGVEALDHQGQTMIIVTSDHGEALGVDGRWGHGHLYENNLLVPLVMVFPGRRFEGRKVDRQVRLIDVVPTVLEVLGISPAGRAMDGRSLLPLIEGKDREFPRESWTYAASTNEGIALRLSNQLKYLFRDAAWPPLNGSEELYDLVDDADTRFDLSSAVPDEAKRLRNRVVGMLDHNARGLRLGFRNQGPANIRGRVESELVEPVTVKAFSEFAAPVRWRGMGRFSFELESSSSFTIILTGASGSTSKLEGEFEIDGCAGAIPFAVDLPVASLENPQRLEIDIEECSATGLLEGEAKIGITIWWVGDQPDSSTATDLEDIELEKQLEALGYLD